NTLYGNVRATSISKEELVSVLRQLSLDARGAVSEWPALALWNEEYLIRALGPTPLTMATTPNGRADALVPGPDGSALDPDTGNPVFALPMESKVDVATFYQCLRRRDGASPVPYLQYQNSSLSVEAPQLLVDVAPELGWASEAFGNQPEAVNLWVGDERSVTSWHRDPYENMYVVVNGAKRFHLLAPADGWRMAVRRAEVEVGPGETLYLPAGWWHAVEQSPDTIAVNYWHDRHWGAGVAAATAVESLAVLAGLSEA
ncbi:hypothetical protein APUTEX25_004890, partial [Auxenochlorella protothecoides]